MRVYKVNNKSKHISTRNLLFSLFGYYYYYVYEAFSLILCNIENIWGMCLYVRMFVCVQIKILSISIIKNVMKIVDNILCKVNVG